MTRETMTPSGLAAVIAVLIGSAEPASASLLSLVDGYGFVNTAQGQVNTGQDTSKSSGFVSVDANNYAQDSIDRAAGMLGTRAGNSSNGLYSQVSLTHNDSWVCLGTLCSEPFESPWPVTFNFALNGTASDSGGFLSVQAAYTEGTASMDFSFIENNPDGSNGVSATFCSAPGVGCVDLHPTLTLDSNDIFHFGVSAAVPGFITCMAPCPLPVGNGQPPMTPVFIDSQSLITTVYGDGSPEFADALDPFSVSITSSNTNVQFASVDGRTTGPPAAVPEPSPILLLGTWLLVLVRKLRRNGVTG